MPRPVPNEEGLRALGETASGNAAGDGSGAGSATSREVANHSGLSELGRQIDQSNRGQGGRRHRRTKGRGAHAGTRRHHRLRWAIVIVGLLIVCLIGSAVGYGWYLNDQVHREYVGGLTAGASAGADAGTENILMVGSTSRCALTQQNLAYGLCSEGVTGVNSDVVMILHLNPNGSSGPEVSILSIPRDLFIPNARAEGAFKIDAALEEGPTQLVAAVEEDFGIPIQHYVELNFDSFANVVNDLGGINMYFPMPVFDQYSGLKVLTPGCHHLDGFEALQVVRARHLQYQGPGVTTSDFFDWPQEAQSDLARIRRDHEFLRVLAEAVSKRGLANPVTDAALVSDVVGQLTVDSGFSASHMANLVLTYHGVNIRKSPQLTVPVIVDQFGDYYYNGNDEEDVEFPVQPQGQQVVDQFLGVPGGTATMTGGSLPKPSGVTVSVMNGTGVTDQATDTGAALQKLGFNVVGLGDSAPVGQYAETVVTYAHRTQADEAAAQAVADSMSGSVIMAYGPTQDGAEVTVTTGTYFSVNPPAPPATPKSSKSTSHATTSAPSSASTTTSSTTTTTEPDDGAFSSPTQAVEPLAPWDPRSCTASGGEGP